jgi:CubicO group peptidase (beta-lactamase class C family)
MKQESDPGKEWDYNNTGYYLLGKVIEVVSGQSYSEFLTENILKPLAMENSGVDDGKVLLENFANGYYLNASDLIRCPHINMQIMGPSGGMYSTCRDLSKWMMGMKSLLSAKSYTKMTTAYEGNYGYGLFVKTIHDEKRITHGGGLEGFITEMHHYTESDLTVIVLSNYGFANSFDLATDLADIMLNKSVKLPSKPERKTQDMSGFIGMYEDEDTHIELKEDGEDYIVILDHDTILPAYTIGNHVLQHKWIDESYPFDIEEGKMNIWGIEKVE